MEIPIVSPRCLSTSEWMWIPIPFCFTSAVEPFFADYTYLNPPLDSGVVNVYYPRVSSIAEARIERCSHYSGTVALAKVLHASPSIGEAHFAV